MNLLLQLPVDINIHKEWVNGHYTGNDRKLQHDLVVHHNAICQSPKAFPPMPSPVSEAEILQDNYIVTSHLPQLIQKARHEDDLWKAILCQTKWDHLTFHKVD
jgi:hypothetical protein